MKEKDPIDIYKEKKEYYERIEAEEEAKRTKHRMDKPVVKLVGRDGNAFMVLGLCNHAAKQAGWTEEKINEFGKEATSGDYDHLLQTVMKWFEVY